jgi:ribosome maturation factor RimP
MPFVLEKLPGLDRDKVVAAIDPALAAHGFEGVELIWRTDNRGWVLYLTIERPDSREPGSGVTLDDCSELSRDLSVALDVAEAIKNAYRLEVGSPGVERQLYRTAEYARFAGKPARIKLREALDGEWTLRGVLMGLDEQGRILIDTDSGVFSLDFERIQSGQLVLDLGPKPGKPSGKPKGKSSSRRR